MGNAKTEKRKRTRLRQRMRARGQDVEQLQYMEWLDAKLRSKERSAHLSDDNFSGEW